MSIACIANEFNFIVKNSMETKNWVLLPNWLELISLSATSQSRHSRLTGIVEWISHLLIIGNAVSVPRTPPRISHLKPFPLNCRLKNELSIRMELISLNRRLRPSFYVLISCAITPSSLRRLTAHADPIQTRIAGPYWKALCTGLLLNWILSGARACKW